MALFGIFGTSAFQRQEFNRCCLWHRFSLSKFSIEDLMEEMKLVVMEVKSLKLEIIHN